MYLDLVPAVLEKYDLKHLEILPVQKGYRNESYPTILENGSKINIVFYKQEADILDRIRRANLVSNYLYSNKFPARHNYDNRILVISSPAGDRYVSVYTYLPGQTIPWESYTKKHIKLIGNTMSEMHSLMQNIKTENFPEIKNELSDTLIRINQYLDDPNVQGAIRYKLKLVINNSFYQKFYNLLQEPFLSINVQILHMDFVRGNILFNSKRDVPSITGIIDFEKSSVGNPVFDIARTLAFLIVDCKYKDPDKVKKYFLYSGYKKADKSEQLHLSVNNISILNELVCLFLLHDLYKFLIHNPYEYLDQNEHYIRTRDALIDRDMIHYT